MRRVLLTASVFAGIVLPRTPALTEEISYQNLVEPVLTTSETVVGEALVYPAGGPAQITAVVVTVPPGGETGWHVHPAPLFGYMLQGELQVDYGDKGTRTYRVGEGLLEAMKASHNGTNKGSEQVRILALYMGMAGLANAQAAPAPAGASAGAPK